MRHSRIPNTDGFVIRQRSSGEQAGRPTPGNTYRLPDQFLVNPEKSKSATTPGASDRSIINAAQVGKHNKLKFDLDFQEEKHKNKKNAHPKKRPPIKKILKWVSIGLLIAVLITAGYFIYRFFVTGSQIFQSGNIVNAVFAPPKELKMDENGRTNVVMFGTSEDDPGHDGADLTDSMMIVSADQKTKEAFLVSIPRDLYVDYKRACPAGYRGKINTLYSCVKGAEGEEAAQAALRQKVGEIFGLDIQYSVQLNYAALREAVDAVGGITVNIESDHPDGILDRNFDWDCPRGLYSCYNVKYPNGPAQLNGKQALYLARARGANGITYGLGNANFDRENYQRKILVALVSKASSAGTLANPVAVNALLETLGKNVRTNFDAEEIKTLISLARDIDTSKIASLVLNSSDGPLVITGSADGQSIVKPALGLFDYSALQAAVLAYATGDMASLEKASIDVLNASDQAGAAQNKAKIVTENKLKVNVVGDAPSAMDVAPIQIFDVSKDKPGTRKKLESLFGVSAKDGAPTGVSTDADFVIVVGSESTQTSNQ